MMSGNLVDLHYEESGQGTPLIFIHGFPMDHSNWKPLVPHFGMGVRLIFPDLRGYGASPVTAGVYSMSLLAADICRLMDKLHIERAALVGHSMGGYVSLSFAHQFPERLAGIGLVATRALPDAPEQRISRLAQADEVEKNGTGVVVEGMTPRLTSDVHLQAELKKLMRKADVRAVAGALRGMAERQDATPWLAEIHVPAVVIAGAKDVIVPLAVIKAIADGIPGSEWVEIEDADHMLMMEAPKETADALLRMVKRI